MQNACTCPMWHQPGVFDWNDARYLLAVAETGSTLAAAKRLRVSQTTVARRLAALEEAVGVALVERRQSGYRLTAAGEALRAPAEAIRHAATAFADTATAHVRDLGGVVRMTALEMHAATILPAILHDLHERHPAIRIELDATEEERDLATGAADIALRIAYRPAGAGIYGRHVADDNWALYCSRDYADAHGLPRRRADLAAHPLIGGGEPKMWAIYRAWIEENGLSDQVAIVHGSTISLFAAVRAGYGLAALPCIAADREPDLLRTLPPIHEQNRGIWLLTHERVRAVPRVRIVIEHLAAALAALAMQEA